MTSPTEYIKSLLKQIDMIDAHRRVLKTRPLFSSIYPRQEYIDGRPLWEQWFGHFNGRMTLDKIERMYERETRTLKTDPVFINHKASVKKIMTIMKQAIASARLDPRLTASLNKRKPAWYNIPAHTAKYLSKAGLAVFSKAGTIVAITAATTAAIPELTPYLNMIHPQLTHIMLVSGSSVYAALITIWTIWRRHVTSAQKARITRIKKELDRLESMRSERASKNRNVLLDQDIVTLTHELQLEFDKAFAKAHIHGMEYPNFNKKNL
jgi:hypothetical protein